MTSTITGALRERVGNEPDVAFVRCGDATDWLTFRDIDTRSRRIAAGLRSAGVAQGDRVATILPNVPAAIDLVFALARLGAIEVAINVFAKGEFLRHQLVDSDPRVLIVDRPGLAVARPFLDQCSVALLVLVGTAETAALFAGSVISYDSITETEATDFVDASVTSADIAAISYTSGTTGPAKGCLLSHGYYTSIGGAYAQRNVFHAGDCVLSAMPCYHLGAVSLIMSALTVGFRVRLEQRFSASGFMAAAQSDRATVIWGTGTMGAAILAQPESSHDFMSPVERALFVPMRTADQEEFELRFRCRLIGSYGQTEFLVIAAEDPTRASRRSCGAPADSVELRIVDEEGCELPSGRTGEIVVRPRYPHTMFSGYWRNPAATSEAWRGLWHHTGDFGLLDEHGELRFVDRKKDAIRRRGENVSCYELELALSGHPDIAAVAVYGVPADIGEDDIMAAIVPGDVTLSPQELHDFMKNVLPYFAVPRFVRMLTELPLTATGKIAKGELRADGVTAECWDYEKLGISLSVDERR